MGPIKDGLHLVYTKWCTRSNFVLVNLLHLHDIFVLEFGWPLEWDEKEHALIVRMQARNMKIA